MICFYSVSDLFGTNIYIDMIDMDSRDRPYITNAMCCIYTSTLIMISSSIRAIAVISPSIAITKLINAYLNLDAMFFQKNCFTPFAWFFW
ncbi:hypothetical protein Igag_0865 [Ignisphaera aggregans DSM 17230]|uniref:Uncharacterized protein n=1 Tax=Ignisphaera aggregans (strain DSM 17230 / JCM 13409 / AQ1.S1) TaxID=583356 RepID=E0STR6_IGNAA|nr:hypothetical protein Igag_0865 [Ignisphaera aggregans DSM 17230]